MTHFSRTDLVSLHSLRFHRIEFGDLNFTCVSRDYVVSHLNGRLIVALFGTCVKFKE